MTYSEIYRLTRMAPDGTLTAREFQPAEEEAARQLFEHESAYLERGEGITLERVMVVVLGRTYKAR
ncbi:hypothetical protein [Streptomyces sp. NRRL F-5630]|uniref:hypothetical protein n=1 Tax=Streptomyces sp. NRRL F-5630 TaxID=1463864 RepID=UPI0004C8E8C6|nr:hypothetical protein [Streptomyces sp. NRRL F-5630]